MKMKYRLEISFVLFTTCLLIACDGSENSGDISGSVDSILSDLSVLDTSTSEGNYLQFEFRLKEPYANDIDVSYQFSGGTAIEGEHYLSATNVISIPKNTTTAYLDIETVDDANDNPDRTVILAVSKAITSSNETIATNNVNATGIIVDNDTRVVSAVCIQDKVCPVDILSSISANQSKDIDCLLDLKGQSVQLPDNVNLIHKNGGHIVNGTVDFGANGTISGNLLNESLTVSGASLIDNHFSLHSCQWDITEGVIDRNTAIRNKQQMRDILVTIDNMRDNTVSPLQMDIDQLDAFFEPSTVRPRPGLLVLHDSPFLLPGNFILNMSDNTHIRAQPRTSTESTVTMMAITDDNHNVTVRGGNVYGDRLNGDFGADGRAYTGVSLVSIFGASNVLIENMKLRYASTAAIAIAGHQMRLRYSTSVGEWIPNDSYFPTENITIKNNILDTARTNCMSVVDGEKIEIIGNQFLNCGQDTDTSRGLDPKFAIDLEAGERRRHPITNEMIEPQIVRDVVVRGNIEKNSAQGFFIASVARGPILVEENSVERRMAVKLSDNVTFRNNISDARNYIGETKWVMLAFRLAVLLAL